MSATRIRRPFFQRLILFAITRQPSLAAQSPGSPIASRSMDNYNYIEYDETGRRLLGALSLNEFLDI